MKSTPTVQTGEVYRIKPECIGDSSVELHVVKVANGKVSYRVDGTGRQRTFSIASFLQDLEKVR